MLTASVVGLAALLAGCASTTGGQGSESPTSTPAATENAITTTGTPSPLETNLPGGPGQPDVTAGWVGDGMLGIVTHGSSTCPPTVVSVEPKGGAVDVVMTDGEPRACTMDFRPRVTLAGMPEGVDLTKDLDVNIIYNTDLPTLTVGPSESADPADIGKPSAGLVAPGVLGVVTYGSSTCVPTVESIDQKDALVTVTFATPPADQACTKDLAPRVSTVEVGELADGTEVSLPNAEGGAVTVPIILNEF